MIIIISKLLSHVWISQQSPSNGMFLHISIVPPLPPVNIRVGSVTPHAAVILFDSPIFNGGLPVTTYRVVYQKVGKRTSLSKRFFVGKYCLFIWSMIRSKSKIVVTFSCESASKDTAWLWYKDHLVSLNPIIKRIWHWKSHWKTRVTLKIERTKDMSNAEKFQ